jgi:hypothetical protein
VAQLISLGGSTTMKRKAPLIVFSLLAIYITGYFFVRSDFRSTGSIFKPKPGVGYSGYFPPVGFTNTDVWIPSRGSKRWATLSIFWIYRPVGCLDRVLTGREYKVTDERYIVY